MTQKISKFLIILGIIFIVIYVILDAIVFYNKDLRIKTLEKEVEQYENAANPQKETIDSLIYNIKYRDSVIYEFKTEYVKDTELVKSLSDSNLVNKFHELAWAE